MPSLEGIVIDQESREPVPDVLVQLSNGTRETTQTDDEGRYYIEIEEGQYDLKMIHKNYMVFRRSVVIDGNNRLDVSLRRG